MPLKVFCGKMPPIIGVIGDGVRVMVTKANHDTLIIAMVRNMLHELIDEC